MTDGPSCSTLMLKPDLQLEKLARISEVEKDGPGDATHHGETIMLKPCG